MRSEGQIYVKNKIAGRSVYTKLHDVLKLNNDQNKGGYENLEKAVNMNYENYNKRMLPNFENIRKSNLMTIQTNRGTMSLSSNPSTSKTPIYSPSKQEKKKTERGTITFKGTSQDLFLRSFKKAIINTDSIFCNKVKCIKEIDYHITSHEGREFDYLPTNSTSFKSKVLNNKFNSIQHDYINDKNDLVRKKKSIFEVNFETNGSLARRFEESKANYSEAKIKDNYKNTENLNTSSTTNLNLNMLSEQDREDKYAKNEIINKKRTTKFKLTNHKRKHSQNDQLDAINKKKKLKNILNSALYYLYLNKISLKQYHDDLVIPKVPYSCQSKLLK